MLTDYAFFGDVMSLDTTYSTNCLLRPLAFFLGYNHHRSVVILGVALVYDETIESFTWLFETFLQAHKMKKPVTIFIDQDHAMARALQELLPETKHGLCTWHLMKNGVKHLANLIMDDSHLLNDFSKCMFEYSEEEEFEYAWSNMLIRHNVHDNSWLRLVYNVKEKWAACYMKKVFILGMQSTQLSENMNADIKSCTDPNLNIKQFCQHFEQAVKEKIYNELTLYFQSIEKLPRLVNDRSLMLQQLAKIYAPIIFDLFQKEFKKVSSCCIKNKNKKQEAKVHRYVIYMVDEPGEWRVSFHPKWKSIVCSCRKFDTWGILCCHALKIYDVFDVKTIPDHYILSKRTREARCDVIYDTNGNEAEGDPNLDITSRVSQLCPVLMSLATEVATSSKVFEFAQKGIQELRKQVAELKLREGSNHDKTQEETKCIAQVIEFKKKEGKKMKNRPKSWDENMPRKKKVKTNKSIPKKKKAQSSQPNLCTNVTAMQEGMPCSVPLIPYAPTHEHPISFTNMLMAPLNSSIPSLEAFDLSKI